MGNIVENVTALQILDGNVVRHRIEDRPKHFVFQLELDLPLAARRTDRFRRRPYPARQWHGDRSYGDLHSSTFSQERNDIVGGAMDGSWQA